jgi:hypothetical protein
MERDVWTRQTYVPISEVVTGFGITSAGGAWRSVRRALARIPKQEADQARQAQLARLQELRLVLWNQMGSDPIRAAEALIRLEAREARLLGLDSPTKGALDDEGQLTLTMVRTLLARKAESEAILERQQLGTTAEEVGESAIDESNGQSGAGMLTLEALRRAGNGSGPADDGERG